MRFIKSILDNDKVIITIPQANLKIHYKLNHTTQVDTITDYPEDDLADFAVDVNLEFIKVERLPNHKNRKQLHTLLSKEDLIPPDLQYKYIMLGFVYSNPTDPNNHKWWLDFRDSQNNSVYNYFAPKIKIHAPITTKTWHDPDPNGVWHGRYVFEKGIKILETNPGELTLTAPIKKVKKQNISILPKQATNLRLRYNIREDIWFCDVLDNKNIELESIPCKSIICDAKMSSNVIGGNKPKVSTLIKVSDIGEVSLDINNLVIRGK